MTEWLMWLSWPFLLGGMFFFIAGTLGVLRFPDVYSRLHAVTKADTLGLGLLAIGLGIRSEGWQPALLMLLIWVLVMASGATACQLLARYQRDVDADAQKEPHDQP
tara:strand:+ start:439 stop:756 length:318 start_codon:yes stop_codon:yes gene_type:complete